MSGSLTFESEASKSLGRRSKVLFRPPTRFCPAFEKATVSESPDDEGRSTDVPTGFDASLSFFEAAGMNTVLNLAPAVQRYDRDGSGALPFLALLFLAVLVAPTAEIRRGQGIVDEVAAGGVARGHPGKLLRRFHRLRTGWLVRSFVLWLRAYEVGRRLQRFLPLFVARPDPCRPFFRRAALPVVETHIQGVRRIALERLRFGPFFRNGIDSFENPINDSLDEIRRPLKLSANPIPRLAEIRADDIPIFDQPVGQQARYPRWRSRPGRTLTSTRRGPFPTALLISPKPSLHETPTPVPMAVPF